MALRGAGFGVSFLAVGVIIFALVLVGIGMILVIDPRRFGNMLVQPRFHGILSESYAWWLARRLRALRILGALCGLLGLFTLYIFVSGLLHHVN